MHIPLHLIKGYVNAILIFTVRAHCEISTTLCTVQNQRGEGIQFHTRIFLV